MFGFSQAMLTGIEMLPLVALRVWSRNQQDMKITKVLAKTIIHFTVIWLVGTHIRPHNLYLEVPDFAQNIYR